MTNLRIVGGKAAEALRAAEREFNRKIGAKLREARNRKSMSLAAVGQRLGGLNETQVGRYEDGTTPLRVVTAYRLCQIYGIGYGDLFK